MARFQIKDPTTGKTVTVEGDKAPTQADAEKIFHQAGLRSQPAPKQNQWADILPGALGVAGQVGGGALGLGAGALGGAAIPGADLTGVPEVAGGAMGERVGQTAGGAAGQGAGEALRQLLQGQKSDPGSVLSNAGQGALYAQIPGGEMASSIANPLIKTLAKAGIRFGGGAAVGGGTQAIRNVQQNKPLGQDVGGQALTTGAINTLLPGATGLLGAGGKTLSQYGKMISGSADRALENLDVPSIRAIQMLFGKEAIGTKGGKPYVLPQIEKFIQEHNIPNPQKGGDISQFKTSLDTAAKTIEDQLKPLLQDPQNALPKTQLKQIVKENMGTFFGQAKDAIKSLPLSLQKLYAGPLSKEGTVDLYTLKNAQRDLGKVANFGGQNLTAAEKFAQQTYRDLGDLIQSGLESDKNANYKDLIAQHKIGVKARDAYQGLTKTSGVLPEELTSMERAKAKAGTGLSQERMKELGIRGIPVAAGAAAQILPLPPELKSLAGLAAALYGIGEFGPAVAPNQAAKIGSQIQTAGEGLSKGANSQFLNNLLRQVGVRLPGAADGQ